MTAGRSSQENNADRRERLVIACLGAGVFVFALVFFTQAHPLVPYDMDDWSYLSYRRNAYPIWRDWNPSRVFPETFMALVSDFGVFLLGPLLRLDYLHSLIAGHALVVSVFLTVYVLLFYRYLRRRMRCPGAASRLLTLLFLLLHFSIFRRERSANEHLFWTFNLTGYYFYILPNLLNAQLVLWLLGTGEPERRQMSVGRKGLLVLAVYLAILSNLFATILLVAYLFGALVDTTLRLRREGRLSWADWFRSEGGRLAALALWLVSLVYEANGGRAGATGGFAFAESLRTFLAWRGRLNQQTGALCALLLLLGLLLWLRERRRIGLRTEGAGVILWYALGAILCAVFEILLCAKVGADHLELSRVIFSVCFYLFLTVLSIAAKLCARWRGAAVLLPLILYVLLINTRIGERTFLDANGTNVTGRTAIAVTEDILEQAYTAAEEGRTEAELIVPVGVEEDNWPHVYGMAGAMAQTLYRHGQVGRVIRFSFTPDPAMNERYGME